MSDPRRIDPRRRSNFPESAGPRQQPRPIKEESGPQIHDEADLVSFRNDALRRMLMNQELLENVTTKLVHTSKITPPRIWAAQKKESADMNEEEMQKYLRDSLDKPYFGDPKLMKYKDEALKNEIQTIKAADVKGIDDPFYIFQKMATTKLAEKFSQITDKESFEEYQRESEAILKELEEKHSKIYQTNPTFTKKSISPLVFGITVEEAPENYNPKLVTSLIGNLGSDNLEQDFINQAAFSNEGQSKPETGDQNQFSLDPLQGEHNDSNDENHASGGSGMMDENMNSMFGNENPQSMLDDEMNDLINFDQADDDDPMGGGGFEGNFAKLE